MIATERSEGRLAREVAAPARPGRGRQFRGLDRLQVHGRPHVGVVVTVPSSSRPGSRRPPAWRTRRDRRARARPPGCAPARPPQLCSARSSPAVPRGPAGNPYAALVAHLTPLEPLLGQLRGRVARPAVARPTGRTGPAPRHQRVAVTRAGSTGRPVGRDRPVALWGTARAGALAVVPPGWNGAEVKLLTVPVIGPPGVATGGSNRQAARARLIPVGC
jgi:molybdopterin molybdotransferase